MADPSMHARRAAAHPLAAALVRHAIDRLGAHRLPRLREAYAEQPDAYWHGLDVEIAAVLRASDQDLHACLRDLDAFNALTPETENDAWYDRPAAFTSMHLDALLLGFSRRRLELIVAQLGEPRGEPQAILDVGSGSGRLAGLLLADHPQWHATLADHSAEALRFARAYIECRGWAGRARCVRGSLGALPFAAQAFDVVIAAEVLEHASDPQASVADLLRVLKPGGRLVISLPINLGIAMHPTVFETAQDILNFFGRLPLALLLSERVAPDSALDAISDVFPGFEGCLNLVLEHRPTQP